MCYTGICLFEYCGGDSLGDCMVSSHSEFERRYGESPCIVGQCPHDPEDEAYIAANRERLELIFRQFISDRHGRHMAQHAIAADRAS